MDDDYLEAVLDLVSAIPPGRAMTYGTIAEVVAEQLQAAGDRPRGGPRQVGQVLSRAGGGAPWWRVVNAAGRPPVAHAQRALDALRAEGAPLTVDGARVVLRRAIWWPGQDDVAASAGPSSTAGDTSMRDRPKAPRRQEPATPTGAATPVAASRTDVV